MEEKKITEILMRFRTKTFVNDIFGSLHGLNEVLFICLRKKNTKSSVVQEYRAIFIAF